MRLIAAAVIAFAVVVDTQAQGALPRHGIAMHGEPALREGFEHYPFVNPLAPKGGRFTVGAQGTFDSLNPFNIKGVPVQGLQNYVFESLMARSWDEPFTLYGLIAERIAVPDDRSEVTFFLNPAARFSDGKPITAADVVFTHQLLRDKGRPNHRQFYARVSRVETPNPYTVRFIFEKAQDRELPLILGLMPILPKHAVDVQRFEETSLVIPVGSGPYVVAEVKAGETLMLRRDPSYWGRDLPVNRGRYNFDEIKFDYYRDSNTLFESFKASLYDVRSEPDPNRWLTGYDFPRITSGQARQVVFSSGLPKPLSAFAFNTRRPLFQDRRVREALIALFDAEWVNKTLYRGAYSRTASFFEGSELSSVGRVASDMELALLGDVLGQLPAAVLDGSYRPPVTDASGRDRAQVRRALELLRAAGFEQRDGQMRQRVSGEIFAFEILVTNRDQERLSLSYADILRRVGIEAKVRLVDVAQYEGRRQTFDYDMTPIYLPGSASPGLEQSFRWGSAAAGQAGSFNFTGVREPIIDLLIESMLSARSREQFIAATRALDRVLIAQSIVLPLFHLPGSWVAVSAGISFPDATPLFGYAFDTWWRADLKQ